MAYVFKEYPKRLHFEGKPSVRVLSQEDEDAARAAHAGHKAPKTPSATKPKRAAIEHPALDRKALIAKAKAAGVKKAAFLKTEELIKLVG